MNKPKDNEDSLYRKIEWYAFMPIKTPAGWNEQQDIDAYLDKWEESDDYLRDTRDRFDENVSHLHTVMDATIEYFDKKCESQHVVPLSTVTLREKVQLITALLPATAERDYVLRFTVNLARILWLDCERERILKLDRQSNKPVWLYPFYELSDAFLDAAAELEETMMCEHDDFKGLA